MAEERNLGLVRATEDPAEDLSKEELQRRLETTRDSISHTVTEIRETVQHQVQAVKDTLDWKEQFKKRPLAWSAGAAGVGFLVGYCIAATAKGDSHYSSVQHYQLHESALRPRAEAAPAKEADSGGPGWWEKVSNTPAYERVRNEAGNLGEAFVGELSNTARQMILPAVISSIRNFLGAHLPAQSEPKPDEAGKSQHETFAA